VYSRLNRTYHEFPRNFWVLMGATFIDRLGGALIFPFFALYVTKKFEVGMVEVGWLFFIFAVSGLIGSIPGGAISDKFGRKSIIVFGLIVSAVSSIFMGLVTDLQLFYTVAAFVGLLENVGGPAQQAMIADLLPEEKRTEGYGIWRVTFNLSVVIGPAIGGFLAAKNFLLLFILDAISSIITAIIVQKILPETKPEVTKEHSEQSLVQTIGGYFQVFSDMPYMGFLLVSSLMVIVYMQMNSTLSVYLRDVHQIPEEGFGAIMSMNAAMVVFMQFWITRLVSKRAPMLMMAFGTLFYLVGFSMYGFVASFPLFLLAMVIITIGEMVVSPVATALVANLAPEEMRGRYMAIYGFSWTIPFAFGPLLAGYIMDNYNPDWVWYASGIVSAIAIGGFLLLHERASDRLTNFNMEEPGGAAVAAEAAA